MADPPMPIVIEPDREPGCASAFVLFAAFCLTPFALALAAEVFLALPWVDRTSFPVDADRVIACGLVVWLGTCVAAAIWTTPPVGTTSMRVTFFADRLRFENRFHRHELASTALESFDDSGARYVVLHAKEQLPVPWCSWHVAVPTRTEEERTLVVDWLADRLPRAT